MADEPEEINAVLTFQDASGKRWLSGVYVGTLIPENGKGEQVDIETLKDRALMLVDFKVVAR